MGPVFSRETMSKQVHFDFYLSEEDVENLFGCIQSCIASNEALRLKTMAKLHGKHELHGIKRGDWMDALSANTEYLRGLIGKLKIVE